MCGERQCKEMKKKGKIKKFNNKKLSRYRMLSVNERAYLPSHLQVNVVSSTV